MIKLPASYKDKREWSVLGPMGPNLPDHLKAFPCLGIDGGAKFTHDLDLWVGDADSLAQEPEAKHVYSFPPEKDLSDLALGLSLFQETHPYRLHFWGFLGGRADHELFNLGESLRFLDTRPESQILIYRHDGKILYYLVGEGHWGFEHDGLFSLAALQRATVKLKGECDYPLPNSTQLLPLSSRGLSNRARGSVTLETSGPVIVCFPEGK